MGTTLLTQTRKLDLESSLADLSLWDRRLEVSEQGKRLDALFKEEPLLPGVVLTQQGRPKAVLSQNRFYQILSKPFGLELFLTRPVGNLLRYVPEQSLHFPDHTPIVEAADAAVNRPPEFLNEPIRVDDPAGNSFLLDFHQLLTAYAQIQRLAGELLKSAQNKLIETAVHAGMAEMATGVLHNIGNALNSLNTSVYVLKNDMDRYRFELLDRICDRVREEGIVLRNGGPLDRSLAKVSEHFSKIHGKADKECNAVLKQINKINVLLKAQENYVGQGDIHETAVLKEIVLDALHIETALAETDPLEIDLQFDLEPEFRLSKSKLMQVLRHLLKNARESMARVDNRSGRLRIAISQGEPGFVRLEIEDNGEGIAPTDETRIFSSGFSTKKTGTGMGLHYCANTVAEMGGKISLKKTKTGVGACFVLQLPIT